jgi:arylsulfatase A-like enzyme
VRRNNILSLASIVVALLVAPATNSFAAEAGSKPNVLFIAIDDLNDWVECLGGHPQAKAPNIDRLAASGVLFTNAHCAAPACNPSRTAIMTGISPHKSGLYDNSPLAILKFHRRTTLLPPVTAQICYSGARTCTPS